MNQQDFENLKIKAKKAESANRQYFNKLKKKKPANLDLIVQELDENFFDKFDCLNCANCCRTLGPKLLSKDIERLSRHLKMKETEFIEKYLTIDEDNDFVYKSMPCPFLDSDNYCLVYQYRPKACREYPHTSQRKFHNILNQTLLNTFTCPAVFEIVEQLKKEMPL